MEWRSGNEMNTSKQTGIQALEQILKEIKRNNIRLVIGIKAKTAEIKL